METTPYYPDGGRSVRCIRTAASFWPGGERLTYSGEDAAKADAAVKQREKIYCGPERKRTDRYDEEMATGYAA
jgi:hypothetical protein